MKITNRKKIMRFLRALFCVTLCLALTSEASSVSDIKKQKSKNESQLNSVNQKIKELEKQKQALNEEISKMDAELVDILVTLDVLEEDLYTKKFEIEQAQKDFDEAQKQEEFQYDSMKKRIRFIYEKGDTMYLQCLLESRSISDVLNRMDYSKKIYEFDRDLLQKYKDTTEEVKELEENLKIEKSELEVMQTEYEAEKASLEERMEEKQKSMENFSSKLETAKKQAKTYQSYIKSQTEQIKKLEQEAAKKQSAASKKSSSSSSSGGDNQKITVTEGSGTGQEIANYACQFVGRPYVRGGTSLTNGADCSGFTQSVFRNFGISIPRTSGSQAGGGKGVSYSEIQPGDIVCYAGHVAIYIGGGKIVHASSPATGIKISSVTYRTILAVRRYI